MFRLMIKNFFLSLIIFSLGLGSAFAGYEHIDLGGGSFNYQPAWSAMNSTDGVYWNTNNNYSTQTVYLYF